MSATTEAERVATDRKRKVEKFFFHTPDPADRNKAIFVAVCAAVVAVIGLILLASVVIVGLIFLVVAVYVGYKAYGRFRVYNEQYKKAEPKPSGRELDQYLARDIAVIEERAMRELGLTPDDLETEDQQWDPLAGLGVDDAGRQQFKRPIVVYGPQVSSGFAIGDDNVWRFRTYEVMVICPTYHHLAIFRTDLSLLTGGLFHEQTQEYQYAHVVSVSTITQPSNISLEETRKEKDKDARKSVGSNDQVRFARTVLKQFELGVSSGRSSTVTVGIADGNNPENQARLTDSGIQQVISSVRRVLRDKKGAFG
jgi:hypothetical protein